MAHIVEALTHIAIGMLIGGSVGVVLMGALTASKGNKEKDDEEGK